MSQDTKKKKLALHWKILIGMALGVLFSLLLLSTSWGVAMTTITVGGEELPISNAELFVRNWVKPFGNMFINALKLIAVPLILGSLIKGVSDLKDISKLSKMGVRTILTYLATTLVAVSIGLIIVNLIQPGKTISEETRENLIENYSGEAGKSISNAEKQKENGPLQALEDLIPDNIFAAATDNGNMLQVIVFAIFFGVGLILISKEKSKPVKAFFDGFNEVILKLIDLIMLVAPIGVFALMAGLVVESPSQDLFVALLWYAISVVIGLLLMILIYTLIVFLITKKTPRFFLNGISPAQLLAFSTSSSAATLPVTMERVEEHLGVKEEVTSFVLPIGATINMDGTSLYQAVAAIFIAQAFGMDLDLSAQLGIVATATLASIGSAAVPGAGMVMLVIVLAQAGIPEAGLALIFAIDRPLDMLRTTVNVTGDAAVSMIIGKSVDKLGDPEVKNWDDHYKKEN
ncbi:dicarboxylate/amino acid:cation symporter [Brumimicrobium aurantiacum]|uniref:Dicarboxylate/amino acid:cation symporter n=1 Tax=Brumimicrobium aurantiacum TaxID=1737063 RepID=A0A3E1EZS6_9FLAO|nr:dicarboxylate/amino acid:cation symporter [Brumimicrobium aurantiacum]RFC54983.1 dicarboxylate/amino acid:cation symporter [Brumimicrobium aurantiacum]